MKIISHHCNLSGGNVYICGPEGGGKAFIIDPGGFTKELIQVLSFHEYELAAVLVTHPEASIIRAIQTISRIYQVEIYAGTETVGNLACNCITDKCKISPADILVQALPMTAHSRHSVIYQMEEVFFTGPIIHAGTLGETSNTYAQAMLVATVRDEMTQGDESAVILPGIGPATTVRAELNLTPFYRAEVDGLRL